ERVFSKHRIDDETGASTLNLYVTSVPLGEVVIDDALLSAYLGPLDPSKCAGHFPLFPALPVAILMHILSCAAGSLLAAVHDRDAVPYDVLDAKVTAENLAFANERIHVVIWYRGVEGQDYVFDCVALADNRSIGKMELTLGM